MKRLSAALVYVAVLLGAAAAQAQDSRPANDRIFADKAMAAGLAEIAEAKLALGKTENDNVRKFARRMVEDHGQANEALIAIARTEGLGLPTLPSHADQAKADRLGKQTGAALDQAYLDDQVAAHRAAVALFLDESKNGQDLALRHFAERALPILEDHYQMARSLAAKR